MPKTFMCSDNLLAYRKYYTYGKKHLHSWKKREEPKFIVEGVDF